MVCLGLLDVKCGYDSDVVRRRAGRTVILLAGALLSSVAVGCGDDSGAEGAALDGSGGGDGDGDGDGVGDGDEGGSAASGADDGGTGAGGDEGGAGDDGGGDEPLPGGEDGGIEPGQLTAGEWRDLDHWDFWLELMSQGSSWADMADRWQLFTADRIPVIVSHADAAVADAEVVLTDAQGTALWSARTDAHGRAELFPALFGGAPEGALSVTVTSGAIETTIEDVEVAAVDPIAIVLDDAAAPEAVLDLMFVIDTTGSMGDELTYLQAELADVIARVEAEAGQTLSIRLSVNFYRDHGDAYVVLPAPFTTDIASALAHLAAQSSDGGGDYEEAVEEALTDAVQGHDWSPSARARLLFFVLDAPPHYDGDRVAELQVAAERAAELGVRIVPLGASGVDKDTEFLMRMLDIATGGTYTFLTNHSGIGGDHLEPTIGEYEVELLNDLLVRVITQSLGIEG